MFLGDLEIAPTELPTAAGLGRKHTFSGTLKRIRPKGSPYVPLLYDNIRQDASVSIGGYSDVSTLLFATPQMSVGALFGIRATLRFLPPITIEDVGEVKSYGIGLQHAVSNYVPMPVDLYISLMYQNLNVSAKDSTFAADLNQSSVAAQLIASKTFAVGIVGLSPYIGLGLESTKLDLGYQFADPYIGAQKLTFDNGAQVRLLAGLRTKLWIIIVNAEYDVALLNGVNIGLGVEL